MTAHAWIQHDDTGRPSGVRDGDSVMLMMENGDKVGPVPAGEVDWHFPGDAVARYYVTESSSHHTTG